MLWIDYSDGPPIYTSSHISGTTSGIGAYHISYEGQELSLQSGADLISSLRNKLKIDFFTFTF